MEPALPVIVITGHGDVAMAVQAMRAGAYDFLEKPAPAERLVDAVKSAMERRQLTFEMADLRRKLQQKDGIERILIGKSAGMAALRRDILQLAEAGPDVLILGETGSGKELVARCLHEASPARDKPFVAINCGAIPENMFESELFGHERGAFTGAQMQRIGKIEYASGGTLFLDEVESLPLAMQVKLLRVLQFRQIERLGSNKPVSVSIRVVAATKTDLAALSQDQQFRSDLYFRLNVVSLDIPPLRARREDIPLIFEHHVAQAAQRYGRETPAVSDALMRELMAADWPGNVRELANVADRFVLGE
jgi:two-component system C4-dicarboxylate transport response regulator DctD